MLINYKLLLEMRYLFIKGFSYGKHTKYFKMGLCKQDIEELVKIW